MHSAPWRRTEFGTTVRFAGIVKYDKMFGSLVNGMKSVRSQNLPSPTEQGNRPS